MCEKLPKFNKKAKFEATRCQRKTKDDKHKEVQLRHILVKRLKEKKKLATLTSSKRKMAHKGPQISNFSPDSGDQKKAEQHL